MVVCVELTSTRFDNKKDLVCGCVIGAIYDLGVMLISHNNLWLDFIFSKFFSFFMSDIRHKIS